MWSNKCVSIHHTEKQGTSAEKLNTRNTILPIFVTVTHLHATRRASIRWDKRDWCVAGPGNVVTALLWHCHIICTVCLQFEGSHVGHGEQSRACMFCLTEEPWQKLMKPVDIFWVSKATASKQIIDCTSHGPCNMCPWIIVQLALTICASLLSTFWLHMQKWGTHPAIAIETEAGSPWRDDTFSLHYLLQFP